MEVSEKALYYADVCVSGDIVSESQAPYLARNFQALIDEYEAAIDAQSSRIAELEFFDAASKVTIEKMALHINAQATRIAALEAQLAAALSTIERATWCEVCGLPLHIARRITREENHEVPDSQ